MIEANKFKNKCLVDFNMVVDTDMGSAMYLRYCTTKKDIFYENIFDCSIQYFRYMAIARKEANPIEYMFKPEYAGNAGAIYGDMLATKWDKVLEYSPITDICKVFLQGIRHGGYDVTINCRNEAEAAKAKNITNMWKIKIEETDVSKYNILYIHDLESILERHWDVSGKVIYLYDWARNHEGYDIKNGAAVHHLFLRWSNVATFNLISPYAKYELPEG